MARKLFRLPENEEVPSSDYQPKIEIVSCPQKRKECVAQLPLINRCFHESQQMRQNKDYRDSILMLEQAFNHTLEMHESCCETCACMFRDTIIATLETMQGELRELTSGWFGARDYQLSLELANHVLQSCRIKR